jgi:hypothetical protein
VSSDRNRRAARGMTLLEILTSAAIAAVTMVVAANIFVTMAKLRRDGERLLEVQAAGVSGAKQMEWDLVNAGDHFPAPSFASHIYNAPQRLGPGVGGNNWIDTSQGCGNKGGRLALGSDAIELVWGDRNFVAGKVTSVDLLAPTGSTYNPQQDHVVVMQSTVPFNSTANPGAVVLFTDLSGEACIGQVLAGPQGTIPPNIMVRMLDRDFEPVADKNAYYPNCPRNGMSIFRMGGRKRYYVCSETPPPPPDGGVSTPQNTLYVQSSGPELASFVYDEGKYPIECEQQVVQTGIDAVQIAPIVRVKDPMLAAAWPSATTTSGGTTTTNSECTATATKDGGTSVLCNCNDSQQSVCNFDNDPDTGIYSTTPRLTANSYTSWVTGVNITIAAVGERPLYATDGGGRPPLKDMPGGTPDGHQRVMLDSTLGFVNFVQVRP